LDETKRFRFIGGSEGVTTLTLTAARAARPRVEGDREADILDATLGLLATAGYDRLTMDGVAAAAKASKATLYRRWSSKAELVIDALLRARIAPDVQEPDTGSFRGDLLAMACDRHGLNDERSLAVMASLITALHHDAEFSKAFHERLLAPKIAVTRRVYERAQQRGEIRSDADLDLLSHVLPASILHRFFVLRLPVDEATVTKIIDEIVIPAANGRAAGSVEPAGTERASDTVGPVPDTDGEF
jgi:AcrR family transcriptional regulator